VEKVAAMLPGNDAELDQWIGEAVRDRDAMSFTLLVLAAFSCERVADARHLVGGAKLVGVRTYLGAIAFRVQSEMPEYLLDGIRDTAIYNQNHAMALLSIAVWCDEHRGGVYPDQLIPQARCQTAEEPPEYRAPTHRHRLPACCFDYCPTPFR